MELLAATNLNRTSTEPQQTEEKKMSHEWISSQLATERRRDYEGRARRNGQRRSLRLPRFRRLSL